jgi:hypothetical protein
MSADAVEPAATWCLRCDREYPSGRYLCPAHPGESLVARPVDTGAPVSDEPGDDEQPRPVCWQCGARWLNASQDVCASCHESLVPPVLAVSFPGGTVVVRTREESVNLGRAGEYGYLFARYPNVSRWHATVGVGAHGDAWITPHPAAPNGTFVNGEEVMDRTRIQPGDVIRLAADRGPNVGPTSTAIRQPHREPVS